MHLPTIDFQGTFVRFPGSMSACKPWTGPTACQKRYPPLLKRYSQGSTLFPRGFPQVFVCCAHVACIRQEPTIWTSNHGHRIIRTCPKHCKARSRTTKKDTYCMSHRAPWHALAPFECNACRSGDLFFLVLAHNYETPKSYPGVFPP